MKPLADHVGTLRLAGGGHDGELLEVLTWEARSLRGAFGQPGDAALIVARDNDKSALAAGSPRFPARRQHRT